MDKSEFDKIAGDIIAKSMQNYIDRVLEIGPRVTDRELIQVAYSNAVATARDLLWEYHCRLEQHLNERIP